MLAGCVSEEELQALVTATDELCPAKLRIASTPDLDSFRDELRRTVTEDPLGRLICNWRLSPQEQSAGRISGLHIVAAAGRNAPQRRKGPSVNGSLSGDQAIYLGWDEFLTAHPPSDPGCG